MTDRPEKSADQPEDSASPEHEPVTYEQALDAARVLFAAKVKDPTTGEYKNKKVQAAWDKVEQWKRDNHLHMRGVWTVKKAENIVRAANIWREAGYTNLNSLRYSLTYLNDEHADALRENRPRVTAVLRRAIEEIEAKLIAKGERDKTETEIDRRIAGAEKLYAEGLFLYDQDKPAAKVKFMDAATRLTSVLANPAYKDRMTMIGPLIARRDNFTKMYKRVRHEIDPDKFP